MAVVPKLYISLYIQLEKLNYFYKHDNDMILKPKYS